MAKIEFTGFVNEWQKENKQHPNWAMKTAEPHRKKDGDNWVTVGSTYRTVKAGFGTDLDFTQFSVGDRVLVKGNEVTEVREYQGKKFYDLVVKAESVTLAGYNAVVADKPVGTTESAGFDADAPF